MISKLEIPIYLFGLAALVVFILVIISAWRQRTGLVLALSPLFALCVLFAYFPQLDTITAGWLSVKLTQKLERADEILARLKTLTGVEAKIGYTLMGWSSRLGGLPLREKQQLADEIDGQLKLYGVAEKDNKAIKAEYVSLIAYDLNVYFRQFSSWYVSRNATNPEWLTRYSKDPVTLANLSDLDANKFERVLREEMPPNELIKNEDKTKFEAFIKRLSEVYASCLEKQGYSRKAIDFFDEMAPLAGDTLVLHILQWK